MSLSLLFGSAAGASICLALGLLLASSRRLVAAERHDVLSFATIAALAMPLLLLVVPASLRVDLERAAHDAGARVAADDPVVPAARVDGAAAHARRVGAAHAIAARARRAADPATAAAFVWALGALVLATRLVLAARAASRLRRRARPWRTPDVHLSDDVRAPIVVGALRPAILLPAAATTWTRDEVDLAIAHERAHAARRDVAKQWAASLLCAAQWWSPLPWIVARRMAREREAAVDAMVLDAGARPSSYAALLVRVARDAEAGLFAPLHAAAASPSDLARRVEAVLAPPPRRASVRRSALGAIAIAAVAVASACTAAPAGTGGSPPSTPSASAAAQGPTTRGASTIEPHRQAALDDTLDEWLADDANVVRAHAIAIEVRSGRVVALGGRDRSAGRTNGLERAYPPGSTVKPIVMAAALDAGVVEETDTLDGEEGSRAIVAADGQKQTLTDATPLRAMSLAKLLAVSSNVGASKIGERLGARGLEDALDRAGLFRAFDDPALRALVAAPGSPPRPEADAWRLAIASIGHGMSVNPLAMAAAYAALADGELPRPTLDAAAPREARRFVSARAARAVLAMLEGVVADGGTGARARVPGVRVAGKTGTAELEGGARYASFVGVLPADAPRWVILVGAETREGTGGRSAAPRFARLVARAFR